MRDRRFFGYKIRRQTPRGPYILDFVCFERRLVIEVDGGQHNGSASDEVRDAWLRAERFRVLRVWNNEVLTNLDGVLLEIERALRDG
jgi:very-short-patch-repair endonuclease